MDHIYATDRVEEFISYSLFVSRIFPKINKFIDHICKYYRVVELPKAIIWTNKNIATHVLSNIPVPAFTDNKRIVITPNLDVWEQIYLEQLKTMNQEDNDVQKVLAYYNNSLSESNICQILGHELVHHSEFFASDFDDENETGIWFEEGMAEYISRKFFFTEEEFDMASRINQILVEKQRPYYGNHSLEDFGAETYSGNYGSIFFEYWRSFLAVQQIVDAHNGNVIAVFESYKKWSMNNMSQSLTEWFGIRNL